MRACLDGEVPSPLWLSVSGLQLLRRGTIWVLSLAAMKAVIIGAGRGSRLQHMTDRIPKTMVPIVGKPMIEHVLGGLEAGGFAHGDIVFVCGYLATTIQAAYPTLNYVANQDWPNNNILLSLLCAREHLGDGFVSTYADIVYRPEAIEKVMASPHDLSLIHI